MWLTKREDWRHTRGQNGSKHRRKYVSYYPANPVFYIVLLPLAFSVAILKTMPRLIEAHNAGINFHFVVWPEKVILWDKIEKASLSARRGGWLKWMLFRTTSGYFAVMGPPFYEPERLFAVVASHSGNRVAPGR